MKNKVTYFSCKEDIPKKNILYVLHLGIRDSDKSSIGGVQSIVSDLVNEFKNEFNSYILWREKKELKIVAFINEKQYEYKYKVEFNTSEKEKSDFELFMIFDQLINAFSIDLIHIHHLMTLNFQIFYSAKKNNIPIFLNLHDYFFICDKLFLVNNDNKFCHLNERSNCLECLNSKEQEQISFQRREDFKKVISICDEIIVPDETVFFNYKAVVGDFHVNVIPNGIQNYKEYYIKNDEYQQKRILDIAFLGQMSKIKGSKIALDLIFDKRIKKIQWHFFGTINDYKLKYCIKSNVIKHGKYSRFDIARHLIENKIDVVCIPSQATETFSYTLSEAWMAGVPVIASDIGALGNRVKLNRGGILVQNFQDSQEFGDIILKLTNERQILDRVKLEVSTIKIETVADMSNRYREIYQKYLNI